MRHSHVSLLINMGYSAVAIGNRVGHDRLTAYAAAHPGECRQTDADPDTGCMEFEIRKGRFSFRLTAPYSAERRRAASEAAKKCGVHRKVAAAGYTTD